MGISVYLRWGAGVAAGVILAGAISGCRPGRGDDPDEPDTFDSNGDGGTPDGGETDSDPRDTETAPSEDVCGELSRAHGTLFCSHRIPDEATWDALTVFAGAADQLALTKYVMGADDSVAVPLSFMNVNIQRLHYDFLTAAFPEVFDGVSPVKYLQMAMDGEARRLLVGTIALFVSEGEPFYGFTVLDDSGAPEKVIRFDQVRLLYDALSEAFLLGELTFVPETSAQKEAAATWPADFPIAGVNRDIDYEVYTAGQGFGTVRLMSLAELGQATAAGAVGFQDILILDEAPSDLERVVSGTVTGTRQGILSHLNVRSSARGTPNCFVRDPRDALGTWEGRLVRLACGEDGIDIREATAEEAEAAWDALRPDEVVLRPIDDAFDEIPPLLDIPTGSAEERAAAVDRFGAKAANLAVLYQRIDPSLQLSGLGIPFHYYKQFIAENRWTAETASGAVELSFAETIETWLKEDAFTSDSALRRSRLAALRDAMNGAAVDAGLIEALEGALLEVFGSDEVMVRIRSSSNAEDALSFSGAGLYDSKRACPADEWDGDIAGPSHCDPDDRSERDLSSALKKVWASLWNAAAYEERAWYGIDHRLAAMGILVNTRTKNEAADIVAFTGNPVTGEADYLVNAQVGGFDVVTSEPGVYPETTLLEMSGGEVLAISRVAASSQVLPGEKVLSDQLLTALGAHLADIAEVFPLDAGLPDGAEVFLDTEWKLTEGGALIVKQIRPFLR